MSGNSVLGRTDRRKHEVEKIVILLSVVNQPLLSIPTLFLSLHDHNPS